MLQLIYLLLTAHDINMPQSGFDDIEGADITLLESVILAEPLPTQPNPVAAMLVRVTTHLPRPGAVHGVFQCDHARFP